MNVQVALCTHWRGFIDGERVLKKKVNESLWKKELGSQDIIWRRERDLTVFTFSDLAHFIPVSYATTL